MIPGTAGTAGSSGRSRALVLIAIAGLLALLAMLARYLFPARNDARGAAGPRESQARIAAPRQVAELALPSEPAAATLPPEPEPAPAPAAPALPASAPRAAPLSEKPAPLLPTSGRLAGRVLLENAALHMDVIRSRMRNEWADELVERLEPICDGEVDTRNRSLLVSDDGGIANVVVEIEVPTLQIAPEPRVVEQRWVCGKLEPHLALVPLGSTWTALNTDFAIHNLHARPVKNPSFNVVVPGEAWHSATLDKAEVFAAGCDIHPWDDAWIQVVDTPWFAATDESGNFRIEEVPPGTWSVRLWHEELAAGAGVDAGELAYFDAGVTTTVRYELAMP